MTSWLGWPPEVLEEELNDGVGVGPLLRSALNQAGLGMEYRQAALEIEALLGAMGSHGWNGETAEAFVTSYMTFLQWLIRAAATHEEVAALQETVVAAYVAAVAAMPTRSELAANRVTYGVLMGTNFFGINTIPISIIEEQYAAMWIRAATAMLAYETTSRMVMGSMPQIDPPPLILKSYVPTEDSEDSEEYEAYGEYVEYRDTEAFEYVLREDSGDVGHGHVGHATLVDNAFAEALRHGSAGRLVWDPLAGTLNGVEYDNYVYAGEPMWWLARGLEFFQHGEQFSELLFTNPTGAFQFLFYILVFDLPTHVAQIATWLAEYPQLLAVALGGVVANLGAVTGLAGLSGLGADQSVALPAVVPAPVAAEPVMLTVAGVAPAVAGPGAPPASAPPPASAAGAGAGAGAVASPAAGWGGFPPYLVGGGPGIGFGSGQSAYAKASESASESAAAEAAAQASAGEQARARRRRRSAAKERGYRDEFATMDAGLDAAAPSSDDRWGARTSDCGAGPLGFAGTVRKETVVGVAGLTTLAGDDFGGGPTMPMVPGTWTPDRGSASQVNDGEAGDSKAEFTSGS